MVIFGLNFGEKDEISRGTILINNVVVAGHDDGEVKWFDTKIEFPMAAQTVRQSFKLEVVIDDAIFLEHNYMPNRSA